MADIYKVQNEKGDIIEFEWDGPSPPTDEDMQSVFAEVEAMNMKPRTDMLVSKGTEMPGFTDPHAKEFLPKVVTPVVAAARNIPRTMIKGAAGTIQAGGEALQDVFGEEDILGKTLAGAGKHVYEEQASDIKADTPELDEVQRHIYGALLSAGTSLAAVASGGVAGALPIMGTQAFGESYGRRRAEGKERDISRVSSAVDAIAEVGPEKVSLGILTKEGLPFVRRLVGGLISEEIGETSTTAANVAVDLFLKNPDMTWKDYKKAAIPAIQDTLIQTPLSGGIQAGVLHQFYKAKSELKEQAPSKWSEKLDNIVSKYKKPTEVKETPKAEPVARVAEVPAEEKIPTIEDANREVVIRDMKKEGIEPSDEQSPKLGKFRLADPGIKGWNRGEAHKEYVGNLIQWAKKTGKKVASGHVDFGNLKGLNQKFGHEEADKHFQAGMDIVRTTIEEAFPDKKKELSRSHAQGDEFHIEVIDVDHKDLLNVLETAKKRIEEYAEKSGIKELPADGKMKPVTLHYTAGDISEFATIDDFFKGIDAKRVVKEITNELRRGSKKTGTVTPEGQATGAKKRSVKGPKAAEAKSSTVKAGEEVDKSMSLEAYANRSTKMTDGLSYEEWKATQEADEASTLKKLAGKETTPQAEPSKPEPAPVAQTTPEAEPKATAKKVSGFHVSQTGELGVTSPSMSTEGVGKYIWHDEGDAKNFAGADTKVSKIEGVDISNPLKADDLPIMSGTDLSIPVQKDDEAIVKYMKGAFKKLGLSEDAQPTGPGDERVGPISAQATLDIIADGYDAIEYPGFTVVLDKKAAEEILKGKKEETLEDLLSEVPSEEELLAEQEKISAPAEGTVDQEELDLVALEMFQEEYEELSAEDKAVVDNKVKGVAAPEPAAPAVKEKEEKPDLTKGKFIAPKPFEEGIVKDSVENMESEVKELNEKIQAQRAKLDKNETEIEDIDEDAVFKAIDKLEERLRLLHKSIAVAKGTAKPITFLSGVPIDILVNDLKRLSPHVIEAKEKVVELGKRIYKEGHTSYEAFSKRMQSILKDAWEKFKSFIQSIWNEVRRSQRGAVGDLRPVDPFYSQLEKTVKEKVPNKAEAYVIKRILENPTNAVRKAELEDSGILTWLEGKKGQVSKEEVLKFVKENSVQITEVVKGSKPSTIKDLQAVADELHDYFRPDDFMHSRVGYSSIENMVTGLANGEERAWGNLEGSGYPEEKIEKLREQWLGEGTTSKFSTHTLLGGENYREILFTLPLSKNGIVIQEVVEKYSDILYLAGEHRFNTPTELVEALIFNRVSAQSAYDALKNLGAEGENALQAIKAAKEKRPEASYSTSHWTELNVLAHVRIDDRTDSKGKKVLFIEEVQSDWHQEGRRKGYAGGEKKTPSKDAMANVWYGMPYDKLEKIQQERVDHELEQMRSSETGVPDAPLKKNWHEFVIKRMIRYASEHGYDKVAWTTGEQQADRYNLSKHVKDIEVTELSDNQLMVTATTVDGKTVDVGNWDKEGVVTRKTLADYIGKDAAKRAFDILDSEKAEIKKLGTEGQESPRAFLEGNDLKVGGEGMKGFYDKIIPDFVRSYTKKWGGVVEDISIDTKSYGKGKEISIDEAPRDLKRVVDLYFSGLRSFDQVETVSDALGYTTILAEVGTPGEFVQIFQGPKIASSAKVHSVSITPAMHSAVMYKGQTLYSFPAGAFSEAAKVAKWAAEKVKELKERTDDPDNLDLAGHLRSVDKNKLWQGVKEEMDRSVGVISTRLKNINPIIRDAARRYVYNVGKNTTRDNTAILEFVKKFGKLSDKDKITFSKALLNSHRAPADAMADMFGMKAELKAAREVLDSLYERAVHAGHNIGRILDYWPRVVKDPEGLLSDLQGTKEWSAIQYAIDKKRRETVQDLSDVEKAQIADSILRGYGAGQIQLGGTAHAKKREITTIPDRLLKYYSSADQSIISYIHSMNNAIEAANFFGKGKYSQPDLKLGLDLGLITESDLTRSIGDYVVKLREENAIDGKDERRLKEMLQAMFMPARTGYGVHLYKNLTYLQLLAQFTPAITQIVDLALAAEQVGYINTAVAAGKSIVGKSTIRVADVGIDRSIYEFDGTIGAASRLLEKGLKYTGFEFFDRLGKETLLNGKLAQMKKQASERDEKLVSEIARIFGPEQVDSVLDQLKNGEKTDDTLFLLYNHLSDVQPISRIEVPERYLRSNVGKVFYALKTYQIKLLDIYRNEVYNEWKSGNRVDAVRKLTTMTAALVALGVGTDELKDWLLRKKGLTLKERVYDNLWRIAGFNKYMANRLDEGLGAAVFSQTAPPLGVADAAVRDMAELARTGELKFGSRSAAYIPIGGKMYYWWFGRGANIKEEFGEPNTEAERKLRDYAINSRRKKPSEMSEEQQRNRTMIAEVKRRYKTGELKTVGEVAKAIKENKITLTDADKKDLIMAKKTGEVAERYKREKLIAHRTVFEVMNTWKVMTDQEKLDYSPLILKKIKNSKSMSMEEKKQSWRTIRDFRKAHGLSSSINDETNSSDSE